MPAVAVESIGAGGGSIARFDGSILQVGPDSAGANPGPACYGLGGSKPTISDADIVLGYLDHGATFGENIRLDRGAAERAIAPLAKSLGLDATGTALGIVKVANNTMSQALRRVTVERGIDARTCTLIAFGGAGPMHAVDVARTVGIRHVVVPEHSSTFSALGCLRANYSYTQQQTIRMASSAWDRDGIAALQRAMHDHSGRTVSEFAARPPTSAWTAGLRYIGQSSSVEIPDPDLDDPDRLGEAFKAKHALLYGFAADEPWELIMLRLTVSVPREISTGRRATGTACGRPTPKTRRLCTFADAPHRQTPDYDRADLPPGVRIDGPAIVADAASTVVLPPASSIVADEHGHLHIELEAGA